MKNKMLALSILLIFSCVNKKEAENSLCDDKNSCYQKAKTLYKEKKGKEALPFLKKACELNESKACGSLGVLHSKRKNIPKAKEMFEKSCKLGNPKGCLFLGNIFYKEKNIEKARNNFKEACTKGIKEGCKRLEGLMSIKTPEKR